MKSMGVTDWFILAKVSAMWTVATVYLFMHPSEASFATWAAFGATVAGVYQWLDTTKPEPTNG